MRPGFEIPGQFEPVESGRRATDVAVQAFRRRVDVGESVPARDEGAVAVIVGGRGAGYFERTVGILIIDEGFGGRGAFARPVGAIDTSDFFIAPVSDEIPEGRHECCRVACGAGPVSGHVTAAPVRDLQLFGRKFEGKCQRCRSVLVRCLDRGDDTPIYTRDLDRDPVESRLRGKISDVGNYQRISFRLRFRFGQRDRGIRCPFIFLGVVASGCQEYRGQQCE